MCFLSLAIILILSLPIYRSSFFSLSLWNGKDLVVWWIALHWLTDPIGSEGMLILAKRKGHSSRDHLMMAVTHSSSCTTSRLLLGRRLLFFYRSSVLPFGLLCLQVASNPSLHNLCHFAKSNYFCGILSILSHNAEVFRHFNACSYDDPVQVRL